MSKLESTGASEGFPEFASAAWSPIVDGGEIFGFATASTGFCLLHPRIKKAEQKQVASHQNRLLVTMRRIIVDVPDLLAFEANLVAKGLR